MEVWIRNDRRIKLPIPATCDWGIFLRNHDELTLEMVTDEERDIMYAEYAKIPKMRLNLGIRRRLAPLVDNDRATLELLYALLLSIPGSPILVEKSADAEKKMFCKSGKVFYLSVFNTSALGTKPSLISYEFTN